MTYFLTKRSTTSITLSCCWLQMPLLRLSSYRVSLMWMRSWLPSGAGLPWTCSQSPSMIGRTDLLKLANAAQAFRIRPGCSGCSSCNVMEGTVIQPFSSAPYGSCCSRYWLPGMRLSRMINCRRSMTESHGDLLEIR